MGDRLWCATCQKKRQHELGNTGEMICSKCGCWREIPASWLEHVVTVWQNQPASKGGAGRE